MQVACSNVHSNCTDVIIINNYAREKWNQKWCRRDCHISLSFDAFLKRFYKTIWKNNILKFPNIFQILFFLKSVLKFSKIFFFMTPQMYYFKPFASFWPSHFTNGFSNQFKKTILLSSVILFGYERMQNLFIMQLYWIKSIIYSVDSLKWIHTAIFKTNVLFQDKFILIVR